MTPAEIIPDSEIERVHGHANFGDQDKRAVVDLALLKAACGYHNGSTAASILADHGLIRNSRVRGTTSLTQRGRKYLFAAFKGMTA